MKRLHFIIGGAQRAGTSFLYRLLDQHPEIALAKPMKPEPKVFLNEDLDRPGLDRWCEQRFRSEGTATVLGEKSTSYLETPGTAATIHRLVPDARLIFVLRDPLERALSNYWFSVDSGVERLPLADALEREAERCRDFDRERFSVSPFAYAARGRYAEMLAPFQALFAGRLELVVFERLVAEPRMVVERLWHALGVDPGFEPRVPASPVNPSPRGEETLPGELVDRLLRSFESSNRALESRYGLDLSGWHRVS